MQNANDDSNRERTEHSAEVDLKNTKLCAEAMGIEHRVVDECYVETPNPLLNVRGKKPTYWMEYRPLHDDAQAMALVKRFDISFRFHPQFKTWEPMTYGEHGMRFWTDLPDLNRAIVECVAKMRATTAVLVNAPDNEARK